MSEQLFPSDQQIINCLKIHYNINALKLTFLPLGADLNASVYKADTKDQSSFFVKLKRGHHHDVGLDIIELLHEHGIQHIIPPIRTITGHPIQFIKDFSLIVYPFVLGENGFNHPLTDEQWITLGTVLRQVHETNVPNKILKRIRRETYSSKWRQIVRSFYPQIEACEAGDEISRQLLSFMQKNIKTIRSLVDRAEQLAQMIQSDSQNFVLCHSDIHAGNVLISIDNSFYIVDWDEPIMAPKERDLMFIGAGVCNVWNEPYQNSLFYQGYGDDDINRTLLAYYRNERIVEDIAIYTQEIQTADETNKQQIYPVIVSMFEPNGVVDNAFNIIKK